MLASLGLTADQVYGDVFTSWLRDTHEKPTPESKQLFREMVEAGFLDRQIILRRQRLGVNVMNSLATALHRSPITKLDLHGNALRDTGVEVLAHLMRDLPQLMYLDVGANDIDAQGIQSLSFVIAQHRKLSTLILGSARDDPYANHITPVSATILLEGCLRNRSIRNLDLSGNAFGMDPGGYGGVADDTLGGSVAVAGGGGADAMGTSSGTLPRGVKGGGDDSRGNSGNGVRPGSGDAGSRGGTMRAGTGPRQPLDLLEQLIRSTSTLTSLKLKQVDLSARGALQLVRALEDNSTLLVLDLSDNDLPLEVGKALGELLLRRVQLLHSAPLRSLHISGNRICIPAHERESNTGSLLPALSPSFIEGDGDNSKNDTQISRPFDATSDDGPSMEMWAIQQQQQHGLRSCTAPDHMLFAALANDRLLQHLELNHCGVDDAGLRVICTSLFTNTGLQSLSLVANYITSVGAVDLGRALCRHPSLRRLRLMGNTLEDEGGCALAFMLSGNSSLEFIDLRSTWLGDRGLIALGRALQLNTTMKSICLGDNHFTESGGQAFTAFLERNQSVVQCEMGATSVPHPTLLRLQNCLQRNAKHLANAEPDALKKEVVRLHFQKYKLQESRLELDHLKEKNNDVKHQSDNTEMQIKQDQSDYMKRIREVEEQIENYSKQDEKYRHNRVKLEADLEKENKLFIESMELAKERLQIEIKAREKVEEEFKSLEAELNSWKNDGDQREGQKRQRLKECQEDMVLWASQRKDYKQRMELLSLEIDELEAAQAKGDGKKKKGKGKKAK